MKADSFEEGQGQGKIGSKSKRRLDNPSEKSKFFQKFKPRNGGQGNRFLTANHQPKTTRPPLPKCKICGRKHPRNCSKPNVTYFKSKKKGHYASKCPSSTRRPKITCFKY